MKELAKEYKGTISIINKRIYELTKVKNFLAKRSKNPDRDPKICELCSRIRPLQNMLNETREVTKDIEHYYERGYWRSEKYTFNQWKSRKFIYVEPIYDKTGYECREASGNEAFIGSNSGHSSNKQTEADYRNALWWWEKSK